MQKGASKRVLCVFLSVLVIITAGRVVAQQGHPWSEIVLPHGTWAGLDADTVDGKHASQLGSMWSRNGSDIYYTDGNVGVGTSSPTQRLDVAGFVKGRSGLCIGNDCRSSWPGGIDGSGSTNYIAKFTGPGTVGSSVIFDNGNVGIGTSSPTQRLDVAGFVKGRSGLCIGNDCRSSWPGGTGDITAVYAGVGLSGGGTSGDVTLSADTNYLQRRVTGACSAGYSIRQINPDGSVVCEYDDTGSGGGISSCSDCDSRFVMKSGDQVMSGRLGTLGRSASCPNGWSCGVHTFDIYADGAIHADKWIETNDRICIRGDCRSSWPGGGSIAVTNCHWSGWVNDYDQEFWYQCPNGGFIAGVHSRHNSGAEDRKFDFLCCNYVIV